MPITLHITFEQPQEVADFYHRMNVPTSNIREYQGMYSSLILSEWDRETMTIFNSVTEIMDNIGIRQLLQGE